MKTKIDLEKVYREKVKPGLNAREAEAMEKAIKLSKQDDGDKR